MVNPAAFAPFNLAETYGRGLQIREMREQQQDKKRLRELLPVAMGRGGIGEGGAMSQDDAIAQLYSVDPEIAMKLDDHQRAVAKEVTSDLANAVRWADTPERWAQVQEFYGQRGVNLSQYQFQDRERGLMTLGKLGEYLEGGPKEDLVVIDGVAIDKRTGQPKFESPYDRVISGPDGSFYTVPRHGYGRAPSPQAPPQQAGNEDNTPTVEDGYAYTPGPGGRANPQNWSRQGGQTPQASGGFSGY